MSPSKKKSQGKGGTADQSTRSTNRSVRKGESSSSTSAEVSGSSTRSKRKRDQEDDLESFGLEEPCQAEQDTGVGVPGGNKKEKCKSKKSKTVKDSNLSLIGAKMTELKELIDTTDTMEELIQTHLQLLEMYKFVQKKVRECKAALEENKELQRNAEYENTPASPPLMTDVVLENLVKYIDDQDLPNCRLVCKKWNHVVSTHLKKIFWTNLTIEESPPKKSQDMSLEKFLKDITTTSSLFPLTKFTVIYDKIPPSIKKFFSMYSQYIRKLDLRYEPSEETSDINFSSELRKFLLPRVPNCEKLYLTNFPCEIYSLTSAKSVHVMTKLKHLDVDLCCKCTRDNHNFAPDTLLTRLILAHSKLESFNLMVDSPNNLQQVVMDSIVRMIYLYANLDSLKHLGLNSTSVVHINMEAQPKRLILKSLELKNVVIPSMTQFIEQHSSTLEKLTIDFDIGKWEELRQQDPQHLSLYSSLTRLPLLKYLSVISVEDQEENLIEFLTSGSLPKLDNLKLFNLNENVVQGYNGRIQAINNNRNNNAENADNVDSSDSESDSDDEEDPAEEEIRMKVRHLELEVDDADGPTNYKFMKSMFINVQHLILTTCQSKVLTSLWKCPFKLKSLHLHVLEEENDYGECLVQHLDTILTGYAVTDCEKMYQLINNKYHSPMGLKLEAINTDWFENIRSEKQYSSIRYFKELQRLSITANRNSSRLTEVTLIMLLLYNKCLTAISISSCSINQNFANDIRQQLSHGFFLEIDGVRI